MLKPRSMRSFIKLRKQTAILSFNQTWEIRYFSTSLIHTEKHTSKKSNAPDNNNNVINNSYKVMMTPMEPYFPIYSSFTGFINGFKNQCSDIESGLSEDIIKSFKFIFSKMITENDKPYKIKQIKDKIEPLINKMLLHATEPEFIDIFGFCCSKNLRVNFNDDVLQKFEEVLNTGKLVSRVKLATVGFDNDSVTYSQLSSPLTDSQKQTMLLNYPPQLMKLILSKVYLPLFDQFKINEYLDLIKQKVDSKDHQKFTSLIMAVVYDKPLNLSIRSNSDIKSICGMFTKNLSNHSIIPSCLANQLHSVIVTKHLQHVSLETLIDYISIFYPTSPLFSQNLLKISTQGSTNEALAGLICENDIPEQILEVLFDKILANEKENQNLIDALMKYDNGLTKITNLFAYQYFNKKSSIIVDRENVNMLNVPFFGRINLADMFEYYHKNFNKVLTFIQGNKLMRTVSIKDVNKIKDSVDKAEFDVFMTALLMNNFNFSSTSIVYDWLKEKPEMFDLLFNEDKSSSFTDQLLSKGMALLTPPELMSLVQVDDVERVDTMLDVFIPYRSNYTYIILEISTLEMKALVDNTSYINILKSLLQTHKATKLPENELLAVYNAFIIKAIQQSSLSGVIVAANLVPSYKSSLLHFTGWSSSFVPDVDRVPALKIDAQLPEDMIIQYIEKYATYNKTNGRLWATLFKNFTTIIPDIKFDGDKDDFLKKVLQLFATVTIEKKFNPLTLFTIYKQALMKGFNPEWRISDSQIISEYINDYYLAYDPNLTENKDATITDVLATVSSYQNTLELSCEAVERIFKYSADESKLHALTILRKSLVTVPYVDSIDEYIREQFLKNNKDIYKVFGLELETPFTTDGTAKQYKWPRFDTRYFAPLIEKFMEKILVRDANQSIRQMMNASLANMKYDEDYIKCSQFFDLYTKVSTFELPESTDDKSNDLDKLMRNVKQIQDAEKQEYLNDPYIIHYLLTNSLTLKFETIVAMLYILTKGNKTLESLGCWDILENRVIPAEFETSPEFYKVKTDQKLTNLHRLLFTNLKSSKAISSAELAYFAKVSENFIQSDLIGKNTKYNITHCVFIILEKHSDLLSMFYKKIITMLPEYKVSLTVLNDLVYSVVTNDLGEIDMILKHMVKTIDNTHMNQACEYTIKKLMSEDQNGLAQELYVKYTGFRPKFRIQEFSDLNWSTNVKPRVTKSKVDSTEAVPKSNGKFKVKLYDYDTLDDEKSL